jgi:hypothetical protein
MKGTKLLYLMPKIVLDQLLIPGQLLLQLQMPEINYFSASPVLLY